MVAWSAGAATLPVVILSALLPLLVAFSLGRLALRDTVPFAIQLAVGAALESASIFLLLAAGVAWWPVLTALGAVALWPLRSWRPRHLRDGQDPATRILTVAIVLLYGCVYAVFAAAPETQPDAITYHLGLVAEYARRGTFSNQPAFFDMLPQGLEMLFLAAFVFGRHVAARLLHFFLLMATVPLMFDTGRRLNLPPWVSAAGAVFYLCTPLAGLTGTSSYNDAALTFFGLAAFWLTITAVLEPAPRIAMAAGLVGGFCYSLKISAALVPAMVVVVLWRKRGIREALVATAAAAAMALPWMIRALAVTGNPFAPVLNAWFPNPYFHLATEEKLRKLWTSYPDGHTLLDVPWELAGGGAFQGVFGPLLLILPVGLLALRRREGRWLWLAAGIAALPWVANHGARFLLPAIPFLALALAMSLPRPAAWVLMLAQAVICLPPVTALWEGQHVWRLGDIPWRAALRRQSDHDWLMTNLAEYQVADMVRESTQPKDRVLSLMDAPRAYLDRDLVEWWQSAEGERQVDALQLATIRQKTPFLELRADFAPSVLERVRFRISSPSPEGWCVNDIGFQSGPDRIFNSPSWGVDGWPNRWETPAAFDNNQASRWCTWRPVPAGSFIEVRFGRPQRLTRATLTSFAPLGRLGVEVYGMDPRKQWRRLTARPEIQERESEDLGPPAVRYLARAGITHILAPLAEVGAWQVSTGLAKAPATWGLREVNRRGPYVLFQVLRESTDTPY